MRYSILSFANRLVPRSAVFSLLGTREGIKHFSFTLRCIHKTLIWRIRPTPERNKKDIVIFFPRVWPMQLGGFFFPECGRWRSEARRPIQLGGSVLNTEHKNQLGNKKDVARLYCTSIARCILSPGSTLTATAPDRRLNMGSACSYTGRAHLSKFRWRPLLGSIHHYATKVAVAGPQSWDRHWESDFRGRVLARYCST